MPSYIELDITTDSDELAQEAFDYLMANVPGYVPAPGHWFSFMVEALTRMVNVATTVTAAVPARIFAYLGKSILNLPAIDATSATVQTTWNFVDNAGYTVPAGTVAAFKVAGDQLIAFETVADFTVLPGATATGAGAIQMTAVIPGTAANGIVAGAMQMVDSLASVAAGNPISTTTTSGGLDAETDIEYLNRLADQLALLSPRPILPNDFAVLAKNVAGVERATAIDLYWPGRAFTDGATTNASPTLSSPALAVFTSDDVGRTVTGTNVPGGTTILAYVNATTVTMSANATGTGSPITITLGARTDAARAVTVVALDAAGAGVSGGIKTSITTYLQSLREVNYKVSVIDPTTTAIAVLTTFKTSAGYVGANVKAAVEAAVVAYLSAANWGGGDQTPPIWTNLTTVRYLEVAAVITGVAGVEYVTVLTLNGGVVDIALTGTAPLPNGTCTATAT